MIDDLPSLRGSGDVSCRAYSFFEIAERDGAVCMKTLLRGFPYEEAYLKNHHNRVRWDDWADLCERFHRHVGSDEAMADSAKFMVDSTLGTHLVAARSMSARQIYALVLRFVAPLAFTNMRFRFDDKAGPMRLSVELADTAASARSWFVLLSGALRLVPRFVGQPDADVRARIETHRANFDIEIPDENTSDAAELTLLDEYEFQQEQLSTAYRALDSAEESFKRLMEAVPVAAILHTNGRIHYRNPRAIELFDRDQPIDQNVQPEDASKLEQVLTTTTGAPQRVRFVVAGAVRHFQITNVEGPQFQNGRLELFVALDVSQQEELRERVIVSERMASLGTLAAGVAHEINNPMTFVVGNLEYALFQLRESPTPDPDEVASVLNEALEGAARVVQIVNDLNSFARKRDFAIVPVDLESAVDVAIRLAASEYKHNVSLTTHFGQTPLARGDEQQIVQVLLNLLTNAAHACADGGDVEIHVDALEGMPTIRVKDSGIGMPRAVVEKAFDPFFSTKVGSGVGLGLAISRRMIHEMDGRLEVSSVEGVGTTFTMYLPSAEPSEVDEDVDARRRQVRDLTIVIVDDEALIQRTLTRTLSKHNEVISVQSAIDALDVLTETNPDLVICDLTMPGMSGIELRAWLESNRPTLLPRTIFITGGSTSDEFDAFIRNHTEQVLFKPFTSAVLQERLLAMVDS